MGFVTGLRDKKRPPKQGQVSDETIVAFLEGHILRFGMPPSVREVMAGCGFASPSSVHYRLRKLTDSGALRVVGSGLQRYVPTDELGGDAA
jgi:SOS-response transcriptional repressor LexA